MSTTLASVGLNLNLAPVVDLDANPDVFDEVRNAARSLMEMIRLIRTGGYKAPDRDLEEPRQK